MTWSRMIAAAAGAATVVTLVITAGALASTTAVQASCGTFAGPAWTFFDPMKEPHNQRGTAWKVIARGVPCSYAKTVAKQLVKTPFRGEAGTKLKSPKGWSCLPGGGSGNIGSKGTTGSCSKGSQQFGWGPATK
jgi:hypothetical protein